MHIIFNTESVSMVRIDEKLVALLVYSSFKRVATSILRSNSVITSSDSLVIQTERELGVNTDSVGIQYSITAQMVMTSPE